MSERRFVRGDNPDVKLLFVAPAQVAEDDVSRPSRASTEARAGIHRFRPENGALVGEFEATRAAARWRR